MNIKIINEADGRQAAAGSRRLISRIFLAFYFTSNFDFFFIHTDLVIS